MTAWLAILAVVALAAVLLRAVRRSFVLVTITGDSMLPSYRCGERVLVRRRRIDQVRRHDVVVVAEPLAKTGHAPPTWLVKRVIAVQGDMAPEPWAGRVPAGRLAVAGDNLDASYDSREFGFIEPSGVLGVVVRRI